MKKQVYRKLLAACVSVSLGTVLLAGCGDSAGTTGTKNEDVFLTTEAQTEPRDSRCIRGTAGIRNTDRSTGEQYIGRCG